MKKNLRIKKPSQKYTSRVVPAPKKVIIKKNYFTTTGIITIILLGIIIYSNSFKCSFHFDDFSNIVENGKIRDLSDVKAWWGYSPNRPVAFFTFALNYHFNQLDVWYWHLFNLVIHLISSCLVYWLTLLIFSSPHFKDQKIVKYKKELALVTALLFVSHPLATQSVTYLVQRMSSMAAMFYLLSLALYAQTRVSEKGILSNALLFSGAVISAVLALLTKENAFTLPFAILLFEFFFLRTKKLSIRFKDYRVILFILLFLGLILIIPLKYSGSIFSPIPRPGSTEPFLTPLNYFLTQFSVIVKYIQLLFLPINQNLDYDFPMSDSFFEIKTLLSFLFLASLIILAVFLFKKQRIISFGIFWFFLTLSVESSIIPISDVIFEHRTYLPAFGFFLILSYGNTALFMDKYKALAMGIFAIIIVSNSILTYERNKVWKDDLSLWKDNVKKSPYKARPLTNRGWSYKNLGDYDKAMADYSRAIEIDPTYATSWSNRGFIYSKRGQWEKAIEDFTKAIEINPKYIDAYSNRSSAYGSMGQWDKAIADISKVIELNPDYYTAYVNRGIFYAINKQPDKAIRDYSKAIRLHPESAEAYSNRGNVYGETKQWDLALADYSMAIELNKNYKDAYVNRAITYADLGMWDQAIADYTHAIDLDPNYAMGYYNRGMAFANLGQYEKAIDDYTRALGIDPNFTIAYSNREVAYRKLKTSKGQ